jgi:XTP/dITP diphosphohydrolase
MKQVIVATRNKGKLKEFRAMLEPAGYEVLGIDDIDATLPDVVEDAETFEGNALKKAREYAAALGQAVISDDSGMCVDALGGAPGVYSARYAGEGAGDEANLAKVLADLRGQTSPAQYVCVLVFVDGAREVVVRGECEGEIIHTRRGDGGFGYDPVFYVEQYGRTMAELTMDEKNEISHRAKALQQLVELL